MYAVIMAGGQGTRLWPLSRKANPKQFHSLTSEKSMIRETYERLLPSFSPDKIIISATRDFEALLREALPEIAADNFIIEPSLMGNAAACGLVSMKLHFKDENSSAIFIPSDAYVKYPEEFINIIEFTKKTNEKFPDHILTIGIKPSKPNVNFGYIQIDQPKSEEGLLQAYSVKRFVEKPDIETAKKYFESKEYLWNAGIFIWKNKHLLDLIQENLPQTHKVLQEIGKHIGQPDEKEVIEKEYKKVDPTTIDYGIMEKTKDILVIPADYGWNDVGTWGSVLEILSEKEAVDTIARGHHVGVDNSNCLIFGGDKLIATVGLKDIVVIDTPDALLICNSKESHKVKDLLSKFKEEGKHLYL